MKKLCLGTWQFEESFNKVTEEEAKEIIKYAKLKNIRNFDTALAYGGGKVEKILSCVNDNSDFIITKIPATTKPNISIDSKVEQFYTIEYIKEKFDTSCSNLNRYPDVLLLHNWIPFWDENKDSENILNYLQSLKRKGYIKMFGVSLPNDYGDNISDWLLNRIEFIEAPYNAGNKWIRSSIVRIRENGIKLAIRSIFEKGNYFNNTKTSKELENTIKDAYDLADYLIVGMTKKENIDYNLSVVGEMK